MSLHMTQQPSGTTRRGRPRKYGVGAQPQTMGSNQTNGSVLIQETKKGRKTTEEQEAVASKFGTDFFRATGQEAGMIRGLRNEEMQLHDALYQEGKVPEAYIKVRDDMYVKTENFRVLCSQYVDRLYQAVKGKLAPEEIKALIFWDTSRVWTPARVYQVFNQHPELKATLDAQRQAAGSAGGQATAAKQKVEFEAEQAGAEETATKQLVGVVRIDLIKLEVKLMRAMVEAKNNKSNVIEIPFDVEGNAVDIRAAK